MSNETRQTRTRKAFWDSSLNANKIRQTVDHFGVDAAEFEAYYKSLRKTRESGPLSDMQIEAVRSYREHGDLSRLASEAGLKSTQGAASLVTRAIAEKVFALADSE